MKKWIVAALLSLSSSVTLAEVLVTDATVREMLPGRSMTAGYFSISNSCSVDAELISASSPQFGSIELHQHSHKDGMMKMRLVPSVLVAAGQKVDFQPGGLHLMLFDAKGKRFWVEPLEGEYLTLPPAARFEWGQSFTWEVRRLTGGRVVSGSFHIASEETARALLQARVPDTPNALPESRLFYGMRLQLAGAYQEATEVWDSLNIQLTPQGQLAPLPASPRS